MATTKSRLVWISILGAGLLALAVCGTGHAEVEIFSLRHRNPTDVLPMITGLLSADGKASADERSNSLIVVDSREAIERIRDYLPIIDQPGRQARIRVRFLEVDSTAERSIAARGRISGDNWSVSTAGSRRTADGVAVQYRQQTVGRTGTSEYFINVLSGSWAYIKVGKDIPYTERWIDLSRRYGRVQETVGFQRIETGLEVKPVILSDHVDVEILPRIAEEAASGQPGVIRFSAASTHVSAPLGQWITIGGSDQAGNEVLRAILARGGVARSSSLSIQLMVESP
jgi:type II secretory pathway component GspD/PulD (secretin)